MNLPKYTPGLVVAYQRTDTEEAGMFAIASGFLEHEEWHYENHDRSTQVHENEIIGLIANGLFIPARRVSGVQHAPEYDPEAAEKQKLDLELSEEEKAFIKEHENDRQKIDVKDESAGEEKVNVKKRK